MSNEKKGRKEGRKERKKERKMWETSIHIFVHNQ